MRIFFASPKKLLVEASSRLLEDHSDCDIQSPLESLGDFQKIPQMRYGDVIILTEPGFDCSTEFALQRLYMIANRASVVLITCKDEIRSPALLLRYSLRSILTKYCEASELYAAVKMASAGKRYLTTAMAQALAVELCSNRPRTIRLSPREMEIVGFIVRGTSTSQIAKSLSLSPKTVSTHKSSIKFRLNVNSTSQIVQYAIENKLVASSQMD